MDRDGSDYGAPGVQMGQIEAFVQCLMMLFLLLQ